MEGPRLYGLDSIMFDAVGSVSSTYFMNHGTIKRNSGVELASLLSVLNKCRQSFCFDCDIYIHESLHNCPACESLRHSKSDGTVEE